MGTLYEIPLFAWKVRFKTEENEATDDEDAVGNDCLKCRTGQTTLVYLDIIRVFRYTFSVPLIIGLDSNSKMAFSTLFFIVLILS